MRTIYYRDAIREAMDEEMARDPMVMTIGEDMGPNGGTWKETRGLWEKYGDLRVKDSPISESGFVGMCVGMALTGLRPVAKVMFSDFMLVAMDQIANQMAKITYMSGGQKPVPMVLRTTIGLGRASAAQHSQNLNALIAHIPGLKIAVPSDAYTAKGLLKTAIRDDDPVIVVEHRLHYGRQFEMPDEGAGELLLPFGQAAVLHEGSDLTVVTCSAMVAKCVNVARELSEDNSVKVTLEQVYDWNPDTILMTNFNPYGPEDLYGNTVGSYDWSGIDAVERRNVFKMPLGMYRSYTPGIDTPVTLLWMAKTVYPDLFGDVDITKETVEYYETVFGVKLSEEQAESIFSPAENAGKTDF